MLPFGPWRPDVAETNPAMSRNVRNVNPRRDSAGISYHPRKSLQVTTSATALPAAPRGAFAVVQSSGEFRGYFGTASNLYSLDADYGFTSIGSGYTVTTGHNWGFCQYGDRLIATNTTDGMFEWDVESGGTVDAISGAPASRFVFVWAEMIIATDCDGDNMLMRNSAPGSYTNWATQGAQQSPFAEGGALMGGGTLNDGQAAILQSGATHILTVTGTERIFRRDKISDIGAVSPECIVQSPGAVYFIGPGGFNRVTAQGVEEIGSDKVNRTFLESVDNFETISGAYDPERRQVVWRKSASELIIYDIATSEFVPVDEDTTAIVRMSSTALTLEDLDAFGNIDTLPYSLDSAAWKGGRHRISALDESYKFGFFDGSVLAATIDTATLTNTRSMLVSRVTPVTDDENVTVSIGVRERLADAATFKTPASMGASGRCAVRGRGKCVIIRVAHAAGAVWTYDRGVDGLEMTLGGNK